MLNTSKNDFDKFVAEGMTDADVRRDSDRLEFYVGRREEGMGHNLAAALACQQFAGTKTEVMYFEGRHTLADQFKGNEGQLQAVVAAARAQGYEPGTYDVYEPGLADDIGDPKAFIKPCGGTTELRKKLEAAGKSAHGLINVKRQRSEKPVAAGALAPDLVQDMVDQKVQANPDLARADRRELAAQVQEQHGFKDSTRTGRFNSPLTQSPTEARKTRKPVTQKARQLAKARKR